MVRSISKKEFVECYSYLYGTTKKEAEAVYKTVNAEYKKAIIDSIKADAKRPLYDD